MKTAFRNLKPLLFNAYKNVYDIIGYAFYRKKSPAPTSTPKSVCFIILNQIGDAITCFPTIQSVITAGQDAQISMIVNPSSLPLLQSTFPNVTCIPFQAIWQRAVRDLAGISKNHDNTAKALSQLQHELTQLNPEVAIVAHPDLRVNQILRRTNIKYTLGFNDDGGGFNLTHSLQIPTAGHQSERVFALAKLFCHIFQLPKPTQKNPSVKVDPKSTTHALKLIQKLSIPLNKLIVLHPFSSAPTKNWSDLSWQHVIKWLNTHGFLCVVIGGPKDHFSSSDVLHLEGQLTLPQTAALLSKARAFIGIDSGPGHIAASVGCPVISVFSSVNVPDRWQPIGEKVIVLHKPVKDRKAYPLHQRDLPQDATGNPYIDQITAQDVISALENLLNKKP